MALSIQIDEKSGVAVVACSGVLDRDDAREAARSLWTTPDWTGRSAVWDLRDSELDVSVAEIRGIADFILANQPKIPPAKMAFVPGRDVDFGMSRMFEVFREDSNTAFRVFRDYDEAMLWAAELESDG